MNTCNQCGEEMNIRGVPQFLSSCDYICTNPKCANYGLLQVSQEEMLKYEKYEKYEKDEKEKKEKKEN